MYQMLCALSYRNKTYVLAILLTLKQVLPFHNILWENLYKFSGQPNTLSLQFLFPYWFCPVPSTLPCVSAQ